jgi:hypothetical protein
MLQAHGEQAIRIEFAHGAMAILGAHPHPRGALHLFIDLRHRQAALFRDLHAIACNDLGVDKHLRLVLQFADINHDQPPVHVDLGSGQANAHRLIHGIEQVRDQPFERRVEGHDGRCAGAQPRVGKFQNGQLGHLLLAPV